MDYRWSIFEKSFSSLSLPTWFVQGLRVSRILKGRSISLGFWVRFGTDRVIIDPKHAETSRDATCYGPLNGSQIRLLRLLPGSFSQPLEATLESVNLDELPNYAALSYVWGTPVKSIFVDIAGIPIEITENLDRALRHLRHPSDPIHLWVDAICIDQANVEEKSQQIQLMAQIYKRATEVDIFLGDEGPASAIGMAVLDNILQDSQGIGFPFQMPFPPEMVKAGLRDIMDRNWFQRMWVVQEMTLSNQTRLICGQHSMCWTANPKELRRFIRRIKLAEISPEWIECGLTEINIDPLTDLLSEQLKQTVRKLQLIDTYKPDLVDVMHDMRRKQTTDIRDRIYAVMGLVPGFVSDSFKIDYTSSTHETFAELRKFLIASENDSTSTNSDDRDFG